MGLHIHWLTRRRLHQMFTTGISADARRRLLADVDKCGECAALCREYHQYEAALYHSFDALAPPAVDRIAKGVFDRSRNAPATKRQGWYKPAVAIASIAALIVIGTLVLRPSDMSHRVPLSSQSTTRQMEIVPRSASSIGSPDFGIRVFGLSKAKQRITETGTLSLCDQLTFSYSWARPTAGYLSIFGVQQSPDIIWYYPDFKGRQSVSVTGNRIDEPLGDGFVISVYHRPGPLWIVAVFSDIPIASQTIEEALENSKRDNDDWRPFLKEIKIDGVKALHAIQLEIEDCDG